MTDTQNNAGEPNLPAPDSLDAVISHIEQLKPVNGRVVFVSGNFKVLHAGHLRLLSFAAECGDMLVVGVNTDPPGETIMPVELRLESVRAIAVVTYAFAMTFPPSDFIARLKPDFIVKGKEYEYRFNWELALVNAYGGKLLFSSGEARFSSMELLQHELREAQVTTIVKSSEFPNRHGFTFLDLAKAVERFSQLRVAIIGDLIVDEYVTCSALGMSQEDPTLVVTPIRTDRFIGGSAIVAAHARKLGARATYFSVLGGDKSARFAIETMKSYDVDAKFFVDASRPTTLKKRYRVGGKNMLRVSELRQHDISTELSEAILRSFVERSGELDLVIFSDFNYGVLTQPLVDAISDHCKRNGIMMVADSQSSSQNGDVTRFQGMKLLTPTEHEARVALRDSRSGLVILADSIRQKAQADCVLITMGAEGLFIHAPDGKDPIFTDRLPAMNSAPRDVSGAGDALLTATAMGLSVGLNIWAASYLGSLAAACQVGRVGNTPLRAEELLRELSL